MTWEDEIRKRLIGLKGNRPMHVLEEETGIASTTLYKILSGERGIGSATLETLRQSQPDLVASIFLPSDSQIGECLSTIEEPAT